MRIKHVEIESFGLLHNVVCSRPKVSLALLFTQILNTNAMANLTAWFGAANIVALPVDHEMQQACPRKWPSSQPRAGSFSICGV
jgi:hypothetical protein